MSLFNFSVLALVITSCLAIVGSLYNVYSAMLDRRILHMLRLNGARRALTRMHLRSALSRLFTATGMLVIAIISFSLFLADPATQNSVTVILLILAIGCALVVANYILDNADRKDVLKHDRQLDKFSPPAQGSDN